MQATRWWWVRHAPVPDGGRIYGQRDVDCDCSDEAVFTAVARALPRDAVWLTSNLARTKQTAAAILSAMRLSLDELHAIPALAEQNLGDWQGLDRAEFLANRANPHPHWFGPAIERAPNGESFHELFERVAGAVEALSREYAGRDIVAVSHGGTIRAALGHAMGLDPESALAGGVIDNCSITRIDRADAGWHVAAINWRPWNPAPGGHPAR
jgi:broad specificity phosphatase PhoE